MEAALAAPHRGHDPDDVAAHHALVLLLRQLLDQTSCLRLFAFRHFVCCPLTRGDALMVRPSPASSQEGFLWPRNFSSFIGGILFGAVPVASPLLCAHLLMRRCFWRLDRSLSSLRVIALLRLIVQLRSAALPALRGSFNLRMAVFFSCTMRPLF